jgi:hypothetical protein
VSDLVYAPPASASYTVTPQQYAALLAALHSNNEAVNLTINGNSGSVSYQGVAFSWAYDGTASLAVAITAKHSFASKLVSNATIFDELNTQLISLVS